MQGRDLSVAQALGLEVLLVGEERGKVREFVQQFKLAVVSADPGRWVQRMFPDWFEAEEPEDAAVEEVDLDDTDVEWVFEQEVTPEDAEQAIAELMKDTSGTITMDDLEQSDDEGWV